MPPRAVPERQPIGDKFSGVVLQFAGHYALSPSPQDGADTIMTGDLVIRYGIRFLEKPYLSIVPGLVALDYGDMLTGDEAWHFLIHRSNLHPRADVVGYRNDGKDEMIVVKRLDLAEQPDVLVYKDDSVTQPEMQVFAVIATDTANIAPRILEYLPTYDSLQAWKSALHNDI